MRSKARQTLTISLAWSFATRTSFRNSSHLQSQTFWPLPRSKVSRCPNQAGQELLEFLGYPDAAKKKKGNSLNEEEVYIMFWRINWSLNFTSGTKIDFRCVQNSLNHFNIELIFGGFLHVLFSGPNSLQSHRYIIEFCHGFFVVILFCYTNLSIIILHSMCIRRSSMIKQISIW